MSSPPGVLAGEIAGRYVVERELGRGATAIVYLARDTIRGQAVAIKVLRPELAQSGAQHGFVREIRRHSGLQHPRILPVLDTGEHDGQLFFVLPYMEGGTLRQRLTREKQLPIQDAVSIACTVADALHYAHGHGLVHRDVKPENILFTNGEACLADFGIARALERALDDTTTTSRGLVRGTVAYMSPEQASGEHDYDGRSDVYSLGCVLYEMLAGVPAFIGPTPEAVLAQRFTHAPREVRVYRPSVPAALESVVMKALQFAPADRFRSASELAEALRAAEIEAEVRPMPDRGRQWAWLAALRSKSGLASGLVVALAAVVALVANATDPEPPLDARRYAVMPFLSVGLGSASTSLSGDDCQVLLHDALSYWTGIYLVDGMRLRSAYDQFVGSQPSLDRVLDAARALSAGIVVWGDVRVIGDSTHVRAALYDVAKGDNAVREARVGISPDQSDVFTKLTALARSLLFGDAEAPAAADVTGTRSVEAARAYTEGHRALRLWDLASARRHFERAIELDPGYAHANLWLVQTSRLEGTRSDATLRDAATQAVTLAERLAPSDREVAFALLDLTEGRFEQACERYRAMVARDSGSFRAWHGLGECQALDPLVVADPRSPSGWRFRASPTAAIVAYARALDLTPSAYRAFRGRSFERLTQLFYVETARSKRGYRMTGVDTIPFLAFPGLIRDTVAFVPYSLADLRARKYPTLPPGHAAAVGRNREVLRNITQRWAKAFPTSPDAAEGHARMLEAAGELGANGSSRGGALSVLRRARILASDPGQRFRLATAEVRLLLKVGDYSAAAHLADSLLAVDAPRDGEGLRRTAALAALRGKVHRAAQLLGESGALAEPLTVPMLPDGTPVAVPPAVLRPALSLYVYAAFGGPADSIRALWGRVDSAVRMHVPAERRERVSLAALYDVAAVAYNSIGPTPVHRRPPANVFGVIQVQIAAMHGDTALARERVDSNVAQQRLDPSRPIAPQSVLQYAQLMLASSDTVRAASILDALVEGLALRPEDYFHDPVRIAIIVRAMAQRAELAAAARDAARANGWAGAAATLWSGADPPLSPVVARVRAIAAQYRRP